METKIELTGTIDNSPTLTKNKLFDSSEIEYIFVGKNIGFSKANNLILDQIKELSNYHLILNPDVLFDSDILVKLIRELEGKTEIAMIAPKVVSPDQKHQFTCRKHPVLSELIYRRLGLKKEMTNEREYRNLEMSKPFYPEFIHGCFQLFKTEVFVKIRGFDERYFLYMEDADICREIEAIGLKVFYFPKVTIQHIHRRGSAKRIKLLYHHFISALKYFNKWKIKNR